MSFVKAALNISAGALFVVLPGLALADQTYQIAVADPARKARRVPVEMRPFPEEILRACKIGYGRPMAVVAPVSGRLALDVADGRSVKAGDVIARYDTDALKRRAEEIRLDLDYVRARLDYRTGAYQENTRAIQSLDEAEKVATRDYLAAQFAEMKRLYGQGRLALGRYQEAQRKLHEADAALERERRETALARQESGLEVIRLTHDVRKRENALAEAEAKLENAVVRAPAAGRLVDVETTTAADGKLTVDEGDRLALLVDPGQLGARLQFNDAEMRLVRNADVTVAPQVDGKPRAAEISAFRALETPAERARGALSTEVEVAFRDPAGPALLNQTATCRFTKPSVREEPAVPVSAVVIKDDQTFVRKDEGEEPELIRVELGDISDDYIRVLSGLNPGDFVLD
ncbi:efflux RND transporter periplasmic adaptor subunit [Martelella lutilitoris]|uniref:efflux RND transporter periplasmic adaptor subunit n=1 Tax=Martelella lutilitoris TaxID=2583532 RepID=UPI0016515DD6|nr:biotin/lipoyl-binding protein [Martelella lutilitoris]